MYLQSVMDFIVLKSLHIFYIYLPSYVCFYAFPMLCQRLLICKALNDDLAIIKFALTKYDLQQGGPKKYINSKQKSCFLKAIDNQKNKNHVKVEC